MGIFKQNLIWTVFLCWLQALRGGGFLIQNARSGKCLHASSHEAEKIGLADCKLRSPYYQWRWEAAVRTIVNQKTGECLSVFDIQEFALAQLEPCGEDGMHQVWACSKKGHLTVHGLGLHLSTKPGGRKAFLSGEKDKFSRWKTGGSQAVVCAAEEKPEEVPGFGDPLEESLDALVWVLESKTAPLPVIHTVAMTSTPLATPSEDAANATSAFPTNEGTNWEEDQERYILHGRKAVGSQHSGTSWVTAMLVLSPLALILGVIIILLNVHHKKKKMLSALKSRQVTLEKCHSFPGGPGTTPKKQNAPASPSPSLRHGEILIEWKDGTVTPLFDSMSFPLC